MMSCCFLITFAFKLQLFYFISLILHFYTHTNLTRFCEIFFFIFISINNINRKCILYTAVCSSLAGWQVSVVYIQVHQFTLLSFYVLTNKYDHLLSTFEFSNVLIDTSKHEFLSWSSHRREAGAEIKTSL